MTADVPAPRRPMSPAQFGEELGGISEKTITHLIRKGDIHARKVGRRWVIPAWVLEEFLARP
jgi:excisionase family DNA binding protein